jgi:hypothetical protein
LCRVPLYAIPGFPRPAISLIGEFTVAPDVVGGCTSFRLRRLRHRRYRYPYRR